MQPKIIAIVTDAATASRLSGLIARLLNRQVEVRTPGSIRRIAMRIADVGADTLLYSWSGDEGGILRWLKDHHVRLDKVQFMLVAYKGFSVDDAYAINRTIAWTEEAQPVAYAA